MFTEKLLHHGGMVMDNKSIDIGGDIMNILKDLVNRVNEKVMIKTVLGEETYYFMWNAPATAEDIQAFENRNECSLPDDYKESLLISNGAILYKSEYEDDGYKLLSLEEVEEVTQEMKDDGYDISDKCYCFLQCLFSNDVVLLDLQKKTNYIMDGDVGYPSDEWKYIGSDINTFFIRLCQCNGAMYWRW